MRLVYADGTGRVAMLTPTWQRQTPDGGSEFSGSPFFFGAAMRRTLVVLALAALVALPAVVSARIVEWGRCTAVTVGTTAVALDDTSVANTRARYLIVASPADAAATIHIGGQGVVAAGGMPLAPGKTFATGERLEPGIQLYGITASGTATVRVCEVP